MKDRYHRELFEMEQEDKRCKLVTWLQSVQKCYVSVILCCISLTSFVCNIYIYIKFQAAEIGRQRHENQLMADEDTASLEFNKRNVENTKNWRRGFKIV